MAKKKSLDTAALADWLGAPVETVVELHKESDEELYAAEGILAYYADRKSFYEKDCKQCRRTFAADYKAVAYCSVRCRQVALREIGIDWDPHRSYESRFLPYRPPLVVPPAAFDMLQK